MPRPGVGTAFANIATATTDGTFTDADTGAALPTPTNKQKIIVMGVSCVCGATATSITLNSKGSGAGTAISPLFANAANGGFVLPFNERGWYSTKLGETLTATTTAGGSTQGVTIEYKIA